MAAASRREARDERKLDLTLLSSGFEIFFEKSPKHIVASKVNQAISAFCKAIASSAIRAFTISSYVCFALSAGIALTTKSYRQFSPQKSRFSYPPQSSPPSVKIWASVSKCPFSLEIARHTGAQLAPPFCCLIADLIPKRRNAQNRPDPTVWVQGDFGRFPLI